MNVKDLIDRLESLRIELSDQTLVEVRNAAGDHNPIDFVVTEKQVTGSRRDQFTIYLDS